jgi:hypothetical protein
MLDFLVCRDIGFCQLPYPGKDALKLRVGSPGASPESTFWHMERATAIQNIASRWLAALDKFQASIVAQQRQGRILYVNERKDHGSVGFSRRQLWGSYDVSSDGQRFLIATKLDEPNAAPLSVLLNWASEMEK